MASRHYDIDRIDPCVVDGESGSEGEEDSSPPYYAASAAAEAEAARRRVRRTRSLSPAGTSTAPAPPSPHSKTVAMVSPGPTASGEIVGAVTAECSPVSGPLVCIDGANVAWNHGLNRYPSLQGVCLAVHFFSEHGVRAVAFLPQTLLTRQRNHHTSKDVELELEKLRESGKVVAVPAQDDDDSYALSYGQRHDGYVVSNDLFRDAIARGETKGIGDWIAEKRISYAFVGDEFLPNPRHEFVLKIYRPAAASPSLEDGSTATSATYQHHGTGGNGCRTAPQTAAEWDSLAWDQCREGRFLQAAHSWSQSLSLIPSADTRLAEARTHVLSSRANCFLQLSCPALASRDFQDVLMHYGGHNDHVISLLNQSIAQCASIYNAQVTTEEQLRIIMGAEEQKLSLAFSQQGPQEGGG